MEITSGQMKQTRIVKMAKGVVAAALAIDNKFREQYGEPVFATTENGELRKHWKTKQPYYLPESPYRCAMITLTYARDGQWDKGHLISLVKHYREWFKRNGQGETFHYVWVMELTDIGRPHYHIIAWFPKGVKPPMPDKQGWWPHGMTQAKYAVSPVGYIAKYASKADTKSGSHLPHGARLWGYGGLKMGERGPVALALAPRWLKHLVHHESHVVKRTYERVERVLRRTIGAWQDWQEKVVRKSGWFVKAGYGAGNWFFSPYEFEGFGEKSIVLSHRGHVEMLTSEGDSFFLLHKVN
jgi:hypothetical protein